MPMNGGFDHDKNKNGPPSLEPANGHPVTSSSRVPTANQETKPKPRKTLRYLVETYCVVKNEHIRVFIGETLAVMIYITVGLCSIAQFLLENNKPDPLALYFGYSVGAIFAVLICGKVSGPNLTTAISFGRLVLGDISPLRFLVYLLAQFVGAFMGALWTWIIYLEAIKKHPDGFHSISTARIFSTYPLGQLSYVEEFFQQVVAVVLVVLVYFAITDKRNKIDHGQASIFVGFIILMKTCAFSFTLSNSVNPMRDFAPRLFTLIAGWGPQTFTFGDYWFWIPLVSPLVGAALGAIIYVLAISAQIVEAQPETVRF